mgnify:CR=1 FL=1
MMIIGYSRSINFSYILNYQVHHPDYYTRRSKDQQGQGMIFAYTRLPAALNSKIHINPYPFFIFVSVFIEVNILAVN